MTYPCNEPRMEERYKTINSQSSDVSKEEASRAEDNSFSNSSRRREWKHDSHQGRSDLRQESRLLQRLGCSLDFPYIVMFACSSRISISGWKQRPSFKRCATPQATAGPQLLPLGFSDVAVCVQGLCKAVFFVPKS